MKQSAYTKLLVALIAFSCLCCSCVKGTSEETKKNNETTDSEISSSFTEEDTDSKIDESSSDTQTWVSTPEETSEIVKPSSDDKDVKGIPSDNPAQPSNPNNPVTISDTLGTGNLTNGGFATGDKNYNYYVTHPSKERTAVVQEDKVSGATSQVYLTVPKTEPNVDYLCVSGDNLFLRENQDGRETFMIVKVDLKDGNFEVIDNGEISMLTIYGNNLYYCKGDALVSTDLNGENEKKLFESDHSAMPAKIAYCIMNSKIYFAEPAEFAKGGMFFGKLFSMDLDGSNKTAIPADVDVCNSELFMSDGELLYFYGNTAKEGMAYHSCKLDGSELTLIDKSNLVSMNFADGKHFKASEDELYVKKDSAGYNLEYNGNIRWAKIVIVGEDIYFIEKDSSDPEKLVTKRISINGGKETVLN